MLRTCHLFAGGGGGLLADLILGHTPIVAVEWDAYACQVLRERAADGWFPGLHVYEGDVRLFDPSEYAGSVDCIHAGFPCQDISVAGKQAGVGTETRSGLYREVIRIAGVVRPRYIFLENVSAILSNGLGSVLGDLAAMGYDARWLCLRASDVGAPHHRDRWWCLCTRRADVSPHPEHGRDGRGEQQQEGIEDEAGYVADPDLQYGIGRGESQQPDSVGGGSWAESVGSGEDVADTPRELPHRSGGTRDGRAEPTNGGDLESSDTISERLEGQQQSRTAERTVDRPGNGGDSGWWEIEPDVGRVVDGMAARSHKLKALGNGQVPLQAATAWRLLGGE